MKKPLLIVLFLMFFCIPHAQAVYTIDGNVNDWGVILNSASKTKGYLDTHTPTGGNDIDYITEDNADKNSGTVLVGPGYSTGNRYDAEAIYFDNDYFNAYLAVITGLPSTETLYPAGDIFIDTGKYQNPSSPFYNPNKYQYAIDILNSKLYSLDSWINVSVHDYSVSNPWRAGNNKTFIDNINFIYGPERNTHYVLEASIPLADLGLANNIEGQEDVWLHWTMKCGNDYLNLHGDAHAAPEPRTIALLMTGLGLGFNKLRRRYV